MIALHLVATAVAGLLTLAGLGFLLTAYRSAFRHYAVADPEPLPDPAPPVAVCKPIEGADERSYDNLASFCELDYPGPVELLIGTLRRDDPIVAVAERLLRDRPERDLRLVFGELFGTNRKTSIMHALAEAATGELLIYSDADARATPDYLHWVVPALIRPETGCVTCLPRPVEAHTLGGKLVALHYASVYLPQWMAAVATTGVEWAIGNTMAQRREVLDAYGGFRAFPDALADDYELGHRATELGRRVVVSPYLIDTAMPRESLTAAGRRLQRWMRTIRRARPRSFAGVGLTHPLTWSLVLAVLRPTPWAWSLFAAVLALRVTLALRLNRLLRVPGLARMIWLLPLLDVIETLTFFGAYTGSTITWGGRRYRLRPDGTLDPLA